MPTYQYACTACDERLEAVQSFADAALVECPACSGRLRKVFSAVGVVFKGSGFYKNDSRDAAKSSSKNDGASSSASSEGSSKSGDANASSTPKAAGSGSGGDGGSTGSAKSAPAATPAAKAPASTAGKSS